MRKLYDEFEGNALTRRRSPNRRHSGMDLIRCRQWGLAAELPAKAALKKDIADVVIRYFRVEPKYAVHPCPSAKAAFGSIFRQKSSDPDVYHRCETLLPHQVPGVVHW